MNEQLIAPCGMNCGLCISYQAEKYDLKSKGFNRRFCAGCRPRGKNCTFMESHCARLAGGRVKFCYECPDFPCRRLEALDKRYRTKYHLSMIENLKHIRLNGMESFLLQEEAKWRCGQCGGTICCHNGLCLNCSLEILRRNKKYRWGES
ncbi:MAG TPA: DUF3795 domain-containing protein [Dehalococcoidales bacterium]|nr:DUF3795 domain-containing protein [Dehalococcoidales bacterium]